MFAFALTALLASATPLKLAAPSLQGVGVDDKKAAAFTDYFGQQLSQYGIRVTTSSEVAAVLGHERQKQMLGCKEDSNSCVAELAGALGVDGIVSGNVAKLEPSGYLLTVKIISAATGAPMGNYSWRVPDESAALDWLSATAREFAKSQGLIAPEKGIHLRKQWWIPGAGAAVLAGVGTFLYLDSVGTANRLLLGQGATTANVDQVIDGARTKEAIGVALWSVGGAAVATAALFFLTGDEPSKPAVAFVPTERGGYAQLGWRFP